MSVFSINDFLPNGKKIKKITTGSELLLAYELDKYARIFFGKGLSLKDVQIIKRVQGSEHFSFVVTNGLDVGFIPERENLVDYSSKTHLFFTRTVEGVDFKSKTDDVWVYEFEHNIQANMVLNGADRSAAYVSLVAYMLVYSKKNNIPCPKLLIDHEKHAQLEMDYVDLLILSTYGNKIIAGMVEIKHSKNICVQPEWEAFVMYNRQRGFMNREYSAREKYNYLRKNFEVGDVVLLYERRKVAKGKTITRLTACYPAVIKKFDKHSITLTYYPLVETVLTRVLTLSELEDTYEGSVEYTDADYNRFTVCDVTFCYPDIGVDLLTFAETQFFLKVMDTDGTYQVVKTPDGYSNVWMSTLDTIYAVFEDRGVSYNKEKFKDKYFTSKNRVPLYDYYRQKVAEAEEMGSIS